jgi:hypothetical protein
MYVIKFIEKFSIHFHSNIEEDPTNYSKKQPFNFQILFLTLESALFKCYLKRTRLANFEA